MGEAGRELRISVNGEVRMVAAGSSVADLVQALGLSATQVAVERNKVLVRRAEHATTLLADGDRVEVVTLFGGG